MENIMQSAQLLVPESTIPKGKIAVAATFTAEPLEDSLEFWMDKIDFPSQINFAPYNQVFQQLLDPNSLFSQNQVGINILLIRFEDWWRFNPSAQSNSVKQAEVQRNAQDLLQALKSSLAKASGLHILCICPSSPIVQADLQLSSLFKSIERLFYAELSEFPNLQLLRTSDLELYATSSIHDVKRDRLGHIPFTAEFFTSLGTVISRRIYAAKHSPYKVIVLDCDNTIWKGIVGEDGFDRIQISPEYRALQQFMIDQQEAGMLLCLCSKNNEADVIEVFEKRLDMPLKLKNLVSHRVNWLPKSNNIKSLAKELNLGLDSFIFLDDNPAECAEVKLSCPEVLTLQLPAEEEIPEFLNHVWAFDHLSVTEEDRRRTTLYQQNIARTRLENESPSIEAFLSSLNLVVNILEPGDDQQARIAQLTQRTNQFNCTTRRRSEVDLQQLTAKGLECRIVEVSDRFGDYGLVGVIIFGIESDAIKVDTFLLSCRVLGRGVEHRILREMGRLALLHNLSFVNIEFIPSKKNQPALTFLMQCGEDFKRTEEEAFFFQFPAEYAAQLNYNPTSDNSNPASSQPELKVVNQHSKSDRFQVIADNFRSPKEIISYIREQAKNSRPKLDYDAVCPRNNTEEILTNLWTKLLRLESVGITDNYFDLGGTSLLAVEFFAEVEHKFGQKLPLTTLVEHPTIEAIARILSQSDDLSNQESLDHSLVLLQSGLTEPPLFLVHDGDGETLLYRNLAKRLDPNRSVYGIQPLRGNGCPMLHTRIEDMASHYIQQIRKLQPEGPYLLGGMCAGGVISFEMACQLQQQGQVAALVTLLDAADVHAAKRVGHIANKRLDRFTQSLKQEQSLTWYGRPLTILGKVFAKTSSLVSYEARHRFESVRNFFQFNLLRYYLDNNLAIPNFLSNMSFRVLYISAEKDYAPQTIYQGDLLLLRASSGEGDDEPYVEKYEDPLLGWKERTSSSVRAYDVDGGHASMLQEPFVENLAQIINAYLHEILE